MPNADSKKKEEKEKEDRKLDNSSQIKNIKLPIVTDIKNMTRGALIVLEGCDKSGKSPKNTPTRYLDIKKTDPNSLIVHLKSTLNATKL